MKDIIKNMDQELQNEKATRQKLSEKYNKDTSALNATVSKMNEKLKLVSTIDSCVVDLREQVDKYAKKSEKKDAKIQQLNTELAAYKTTQPQVEQAIAKLESDNCETLKTNQELLSKLNQLQSKHFANGSTQTNDSDILNIEPLIRQTKHK